MAKPRVRSFLTLEDPMGSIAGCPRRDPEVCGLIAGGDGPGALGARPPAEDAAPEATKRQRTETPAAAADLADDAPAAGTSRTECGITAAATAEQFEEWCKKTLAALDNGTGQMTAEDLLKVPEAFQGYKFTGLLRPAHVTPQMRPPLECSMPDYATHPKGVARAEFLRSNRKSIPIWEGADLETIREAGRLGREVLDIASRFLRAGVTGEDVDRIVWQACADRGLYPSPLNYFGFPKSVCVSPNEVICHGIPNCRPIEIGDIVNLDISVCYKGFHSDLNETFFIGACSEESHVLVRTAYDALLAAARIIRPGAFYRALGAEIEAEAKRHGCAVVPNYCGHGVGKLFHGPPEVPHYRKNKAIGTMKPGHVFTVEPMLNLSPKGADVTWPDGWTAVTKDGHRSAQFEHTFLVTEDGYEVLTAIPGTDRLAMAAFDPAFFQR